MKPESAPSSRTGFALGAGGLLILAVHLVYFLPATCDDAFISLRYVRNFVAGAGLVFNPGERVEGFSNPLWVFLVSGFAAIGLDPLAAAKGLGIASVFALLFFTLRPLRRAGWQPLEIGGLVFLLGCSWPLAYYAVSGLETIFYAALLAAGASSVSENDGRLTLGASLWLLAAALTRPEGVIFFGILAAVHVARRREIGSVLGPAFLFAVGYAAFLAWRHGYYGTWVPNTYLVKSPMREGLGGAAWVRLFAGGMDEIVAFVAHNGGPVFVLLAVLGCLAGNRAVFVVAGAMFVGGLFFIKFAGGDWMMGYRFLVPFLPFYLVLAIEGLRQIRSKLSVSSDRLQVGTAVVLAAIGLFNLHGTFEFHLQRGRYPYFIMTSYDLVRPARWIGEHYPPSTKIVSWRIGALAYYSGLSVIDVWGLTDARIAELRYTGKLTPEAALEYLDQLHPRLTLTADRLEPGEERTFGKVRYRVVKVFPQGTNSVWTLFEAAEAG